MRLISFDPRYELSRYASALPRQLSPGEDPVPQPPKVVVEFTRAEFGNLLDDIQELLTYREGMGFPDNASRDLLAIGEEAGYSIDPVQP
jgi:hypothetical protein